jgi:hypothetical protein
VPDKSGNKISNLVNQLAVSDISPNNKAPMKTAFSMKQAFGEAEDESQKRN